MVSTARNWVFLGDSLTEGVGSQRVSHVTELAKQLRAQNDGGVHEFRLRQIDADAFRQIDFNVAGFMNVDNEHLSNRDLWLWNLACEGKTIDSDFAWLPLIATLKPELVIVFRGSLESIIRPAVLRDGAWPWWTPASWRGYAALDPRCYFSTTWWRKAKQRSVDALKQKARLKLLKERDGEPLMDVDRLVAHHASLLKALRELSARVVVLGLLPVSEDRFPGSPDHFKTVNAKLREVTAREGAEFFDWAAQLTQKDRPADLFYRDGFHPNAAGARVLAQILQAYLSRELSAATHG
jgi:lysophospholipase L1-like esterase